MISETKIDNSFPIANFLIDGFGQPYRIEDRSKFFWWGNDVMR